MEFLTEGPSLDQFETIVLRSSKGLSKQGLEWEGKLLSQFSDICAKLHLRKQHLLEVTDRRKGTKQGEWERQ
jgi:hypothetical protein